MKKRILFLKNKAGELLKTKGNGQKQTENKAKTKLPKLLKKKKGRKNKAKTNRKTKLAMLLKIKDLKKQTHKPGGWQSPPSEDYIPGIPLLFYPADHWTVRSGLQ